MKKFFYLTTLGSLMLIGCSSEPSFKIIGHAPADIKDGGYVYLTNEKSEILDSAQIKNNTFIFEGRQDTPTKRWFNYQKGNHSFSGYLFVENGEINISYDEGRCKITGTPNNDIFNDFSNKYLDITHKMRETYQRTLDKSITEDDRKTLNDEIQQMSVQSKDLILQTINANLKNPVGAEMIPVYGRVFSNKQQKEWILNTPENLRNDVLKKVLHQIETVENTAVGKKFIDFTLKDINGETVKLSDIVSKNKVTLLDFWASWCGPCRAEMPNVVKAYKNYHKKGFEIVGVSLDKNAEDWKKAVKELNMNWKHLSSLKGWACNESKLYGISGIPATILIDQNGTIIARNLRGKELEIQLKALLR